MLDHGTSHMARTSLRMLRRSLDLSEVARTSDVNPKTARSDWNDERSNGSPDTFIVTFARNHLYGMHAPWISDVWSRIVHQWPRNDSGPRDKFVTAISTIYRQMLQRPETIARWQVHLYVAAAHRNATSSAAANDMSSTTSNATSNATSTVDDGGATGATDGADGPADADAALVRELIGLRHAYDDHVTTLWQLPLRVVLAEMERRPRDGIDERTIARELHTSMDGHVLRSLAEARPFSEEEARDVGWHTLLLLEGFTEPDTPAPHPSPDDLPGWVLDVAAYETLVLHRSCSADRKDPDGDAERDAEGDPESAVERDGESGAAGNGVDRDQVLQAVLDRCPTEHHPQVRRVFDQRFPDLHALREAALRRCLRRRVDAVREMYEVIPAPVLRQLLSSVRTAGSTDSFLLRCCREDQQSGAPSYLTELEALLRDLLVTIGTNRPDQIATILLGQALDGDHKAVEGLLTVIIPPDADQRELAELQAAAADQIGQEGGEVGP